MCDMLPAAVSPLFQRVKNCTPRVNDMGLGVIRGPRRAKGDQLGDKLECAGERMPRELPGHLSGFDRCAHGIHHFAEHARRDVLAVHHDPIAVKDEQLERGALKPLHHAWRLPCAAATGSPCEAANEPRAWRGPAAKGCSMQGLWPCLFTERFLRSSDPGLPNTGTSDTSLLRGSLCLPRAGSR